MNDFITPFRLLITTVTETLRTFLLTLLPKYVLIHIMRLELKIILHPDWNHIRFYKSARSALFTILQSFGERHPQATVYLPEYTCNVVHKCALKAQLKIIDYRVNRDFTVCEDDVLGKIEKNSPCVVLLASLAGTPNNSPELVEKIRNLNNNALVVLDECQNFIAPSRIIPSKNSLLLFSFNMKQIPGIMGGGFASVDELSWLSTSETSHFKGLCLESLIFLRMLKNMINKLTLLASKEKDKPHDAYVKNEYSSCTRLDFEINEQSISKVSVALAIVQMRKLKQIQQARKNNAKFLLKALKDQQIGIPIMTELLEHSPYIPLRLKRRPDQFQVLLRGPYALQGHSSLTLRPDVIYLRNDDVYLVSFLICRFLRHYKKQKKLSCC